MGALLAVIAGASAVNTVVVIFYAVTGSLPPVTPTARAVDAIWTFCLGVWALWLLAANRGRE